jgi:serine/threonine-protein kinase
VVDVRDWTLTSALGTFPVTLPAHLDDELPAGPSQYSLRARVPLPVALRGRALTLTIAHLPALVELRANGHEAVRLDVTAFDRYRSNGPHRWRILAEHTQGEALDLELDVRHRWSESAWIDWIPALSATPAGDFKYVAVTTFNQVTAIGALVTMLLVSLLYGIIFLLDPSRVVNGWHALQGTFAAMYPALLLGYLQPVLGTFELQATAMCVIVSTICSVYYVAAIFQNPAPTRAWWLLLVPGAVACVAFAGPFHATAVAPPVVFALLAVSAFGVVTYVRARKKGPVAMGPTIAAFGYPLASVLGIPDGIALLGFGSSLGGLRGSALAIGALSMAQAITLSRSHSESLQRTDQLNEQLKARVLALEATNREVGVLNDELRRQVAARSENLADVLARLGPVFARPRDFAAGDVIDTRYRVVRRIGEGGMGTVYEVERVSDGRHLALKVLQGYRTGGELARLAREAQIAARVDHPNVVSMVDVDVSASGAVFLVMEYVEGCSLDELHARYGDTAWALGLLKQIAEGLAVMHTRDIVHRDLKPGNVLVTRDASGADLAKIADFGIATLGSGSDETTAPRDEYESDSDKTTAPRAGLAHAATVKSAPDAAEVGRGSRPDTTTDRNLTKTGQVLGTPVYMAPELAFGASHATPASDMYAVGVMAFELLTGGVPSGYERLDHLRGKQRQTPGFGERARGLAPRVAEILERCLAPEPEVRPTARELADVLSVAA